MIRRIYDKTLMLAETRHAMLALALVSFAESSVFPIPPDVLMIPMIIARPDRAWRIAGVALVASVLGGLADYAIGAGLFNSVGRRPSSTARTPTTSPPATTPSAPGRC